MSSPMRLFRPDFHNTFKDLSDHERELSAQTMDTIYDSITKIVEGESVDGADTPRLIKESIEVIMQAIWPQRGQLLITHPGGSYLEEQKSTPANHPEDPVNADSTNNATETPPSGDPSIPDSPGSSSGNNAAQTPPEGGPSALGPGIGHHPLGSTPGRGAPRGQTAPRGQGRGGHRGGGHHGGGHRGGGHRGGGTAFTPSPAVNHQFTRRINDLPMPSGRHVQRTFAFTELSPPDAQTIVLGPPPPPTLPSHGRISTLPPRHPSQFYGLGAFPPNHNIPGVSSGDSSSGTTSEIKEEIKEEVVDASIIQPVLADQSLNSSENLKKRSRDDEDDEEEQSRPSIRLRIEAPPQSSQLDDTTTQAAPVASSSTLTPSKNNESKNEKKRSRDDEDDEEEQSRPSIRLRIEAPPQSSQPDDTTTQAAPVASSSTLTPSKNDEGSNNNGSPKKNTRDAKEDEKEFARPSTRMPAVRPRYPSPTPSDRRIGRIIAPFGTSTRFNPRPSEADIGSLEVAHNEGNPPDNSPASSSGSLPLASSDTPSPRRSSQRIKGQKAKKASKEA